MTVAMRVTVATSECARNLVRRLEFALTERRETRNEAK
jgi:hypothetical protein